MSLTGKAGDRAPRCEELQALLVDHADGALAPEAAALVEAHCARCPSCRESLTALREIPAMLRQPGEMPPVVWQEQRARIMAAVDDVAAADAARRSGFDARLLLPLAASLVIAIAGVVSLRSGNLGDGATQPARAALELAMHDPVATAELSEVLGEPLVFSASLWSEEEPVDVQGPWLAPGSLGEAPDLDELSEEELTEVERLLGV